MNVLGIFRGFPGLGRVVSGMSILETLRDQYKCEIKIVTYLQGNKYLESRGYKDLHEAIPMDYCSIGLLPTNKMGVHINNTIKQFKPDVIIVDGEPLIIHSLRLSHPELKIVALLNPSDVDNKHNDVESMDFFNSLYSLVDLAVIHGLRQVTTDYPYRRLLSVRTILRREIFKIENNPEKEIYCILGGGTVNVSSQFELSTIYIAELCQKLALYLVDYNMNIVCSSKNIYDAISDNHLSNNVILHNKVLHPEECYSNAALIITRSGRNTLSELAYLGIPTISFITGDNYRKVEQEQNINDLNAKNIIPIPSNITIDKLAKEAIRLIKSGIQKREFKTGNTEVINNILSLF